MKKLLIIAIAIFAVASVHSQKRKVNAAQAYLENGDIEAAEKRMTDEVFEHKRSKDWPKTYLVAAQLANEKYKQEGDLDLLRKAVDHYKEAIELDKKENGRFENEIKVALTFFVSELTNAGIEGFNQQNYEQALFAFENVLNINDLEMMKEDDASVDTAIVYNTALAAYNAEEWEKAAKYLDKSIELDYKEGKGDAVLLLHQVYGTLEDSSEIADNLKRGFEKYPEDDRILTQLINYYLENNQNDQAMEYLNQALEKDSDNASFYYARGVLYDQMEEYDKAIEDYKATLENEEDYFDALYNLGVIYFNKGVEQMNVANEEKDHEKYQEEKAKADSIFKESLPYMERALQEKPEEVSVLESLKGLYYRFEMNDKYDEVNAKLKELKGSTESSTDSTKTIE